MIPVSLKIKGLYSYQAEQTIEFDRLLEGQLFGIFGSVGSGKSSVLEAMTFALYGHSERLDRNDNRNYNMMNLKSDELLIDFIFRNFDEQEYRFTVRGKRNGKDFDKVNTFERAAYKKEKGGEWTPLESSNADNILGLSYDNFKRTVIIPQGKFQEFLQLGDKARTDMLKEIFQLEKYEFFYQTSALEKKNNELIQHLSGQLAHYEQISSEGIEAKETLVRKLTDDLSLQKTTVQKVEKHVKEQESLKKLFEDLEIQRSALAELLQHEEKFSSYSKKITDYEFCLRHFKEGLNRKKELDTDIEKRQALISQSSESLKKCTAELETLERSFEEVKQDQQKQEERRLLVEDYQHLLSLKSVQSDLLKLKDRLELGKPHLDKALSEKTSAELRIERLREQIRTQKSLLPDVSVLSAVKNWHTERHSIERHIKNFEEELEKVQTQISTLSEQLAPHLVPPVFKNVSAGKPFSQYAEQVNQLRAENREKQEALASQIAHYSVQLRLGEFAGQLSKGGPCLLCGSEHHPKLLMVDDVNEHLTNAHREVKAHEHYDKSCERVLQVLHGVQLNEQTLIQQSAGLKKKLQEEAKRMEEHLSRFIWAESWKDEKQLEESFQQFSLENNKLNVLEKELEGTEKAYREASGSFEKFRKAIDEIQSAITAKTAEEAILIRQLKRVSLSESEHRSEEELEMKIQELNQKIEAVKQLFEKLSAQIDEHKSARIMLLERINTNGEILRKDEAQLVEIDKELEACFEKSDFGCWEEIEMVLQENLDLNQLKTELQLYQQKVYNIRETLKQLEAQASGKSFDLMLFNNLLLELSDKQRIVQELNDAYVKEKAVLDKQKQDLEQKTLLESQLEKQQKRGANLNLMKQLFKGSGFVNFVSSVYLHNLCEAANERFYKLTRQSLRLEVTEKNEFQVRDFLNNGKVRNVKTLSGGQTFQASLSLALALAESVQQQNKSKQNFFFLDEGFGSLDKESLQVAFETLKSLRKENRKVGIISHVEELQQEIDVFLKVTNDAFSGSKIEASWEN